MGVDAPTEDTSLLTSNGHCSRTGMIRRKMNGPFSKAKITSIVSACLLLIALGAMALLRSTDLASGTRIGNIVDRMSGEKASTSSRYPNGNVSVAFIGNSMLYFNDFPRFFEEISNDTEIPIQVSQNSCLHGGASLPSILIEGNAMYPQFMTEEAILGEDIDGNIIYDFGACTVPQLLVGYDERIYDPGYAQPFNEESETHQNQNPCRADSAYLRYAVNHYGGLSYSEHSKSWDFILLNDNTRNPARATTRALTLQTLERFYVSWFLETGATPVFLWTQAYANDLVERNLTGGMDDVANFTSLTRVGYQAYVDLLNLHLPKEQAPRIAPVGLGFLTVYEEDYDLWKTLFHSDHLHASPSGTFLQGCIVYYTLFGRMPNREWMIRPDDEIPLLWRRARMMQHAWEPPNPFPTQNTTEYLYRVAERIMKEGYIPKSFINYQNGEAADF